MVIAEFVDTLFRLIRMFEGAKVAFNRHSRRRQRKEWTARQRAFSAATLKGRMPTKRQSGKRTLLIAA